MDIKAVHHDLLLDQSVKVERPLKKTAGAADTSKKETQKAAREFEAMFASLMLKSMRSTVGKDPLTGGGQGEEIYRSLLDQEYASIMASGDGLGLAKIIEQQLTDKK